MVFNATFNNTFFCISVISWQSVLLVKETEYPGENHRLAASHLQSLSHNVLLSTLEFYSNLQL
jgi:signal transduction histidine kinase